MTERSPEPSIANTYKTSFSDLVMFVAAIGLLALAFLGPSLR